MIQVETIVRSMLMVAGREPKGIYYPKYLQLALQGVRELQSRFQVVPERNHHVTDIDQTLRTAPLPNDYVMWKSCGYLCGNEYVRMYHNSQLTSFWLKDDCGDPIAGTCYDNPGYWAWWGANGYYGIPPYGVYWGGRLYGMGGGSSNGGFNVDESKGLILFDSQVDLSGNKPIILVYNSSGINPDGQTFIHDYAAEALRAYVRYQLAVNSNNPKQGEIALHRQIFDEEARLAKVKIYSLPIAEIADRIRQGTQSAPTY